MLVRYLPGKFDEKIPLPVQKRITAHGREGEGSGTLVFEVGGGKREEIDLERCAPLMSGEKKIKVWLKMSGLFILLISFCAGAYNVMLKIYSSGFSVMNVLNMVQLVVSLLLVGYVSLVFKVTIERYLYGGISFDRGDIYFQTDDEKAMFRDILNDQRR